MGHSKHTTFYIVRRIRIVKRSVVDSYPFPGDISIATEEVCAEKNSTLSVVS